MILSLLACVSPAGPDSPHVEHVPGHGPGAGDVEALPRGDAPDEDVPDSAVVFDVPHGLYDEPFTVAMSTELTQGELRYTLDGTDPVEGGLPYEGPVDVTTTTILRAAVILDDTAISRTTTASYIFPAHVPDQAPPEDWPRLWWTDESGGPWAGDYEMDADVMSGAAWQAHADLFEALPVVSVVMDPDDLWDERRGIHENPRESGVEWERAASVELIDGDAGFTIDCGIRSHGGSGRRPDRSPKKSFRLHFRGERGPSSLEYAVFPDSSLERFEKLVLRAGYNRSWVHFDHPGRKRADYVRERFGHEVYRAMGYAAPHVRHVHLFLDGLYWGLYQLEERPDADFLAAYVGGTPESWDVLNTGEVKAGDDVAWQELLELVDADLSDPAAYAAVEARVDVGAFADYVAYQYTLGNIDWPDRNWYAARPREDDGRWRFYTWDNEYLLGTTDDVRLETWEGSPGEVFYAMMANEEFRVAYADAVYRLIAPGGAFDPTYTVPLFTTLAEAIVPGILAESARWGDHWRDVRGDPEAVLYTYEEHWAPELARITTDFLPDRAAYALAAYRDAGLYPPMDPPIASPGGGTVPAGDTVVLTAPDGEVWYTVDGSDPRARGG